MAFNIAARIDDLLYVDDLTKHSDQFSSVPTVSVVAHKRVSLQCSAPISSTPYATAFTTPTFSPTPLVSPVKGERPLLINSRPINRGFSVKKALTDYLGVEVKGKSNSDPVEASEFVTYAESPESKKGIASPPLCD